MSMAGTRTIPGLHKLLLYLVALAMQFSACQAIARHDPGAELAAQAARHAELSVQMLAHGHVHDDGEGDERRWGHIHGHNSGDHNHDMPMEISPPDLTFQQDLNGWRTSREVELTNRVGGRLDRPPELLSSM